MSSSTEHSPLPAARRLAMIGALVALVVTGAGQAQSPPPDAGDSIRNATRVKTKLFNNTVELTGTCAFNDPDHYRVTVRKNGTFVSLSAGVSSPGALRLELLAKDKKTIIGRASLTGGHVFTRKLDDGHYFVRLYSLSQPSSYRIRIVSTARFQAPPARPLANLRDQGGGTLATATRLDRNGNSWNIGQEAVRPGDQDWYVLFVPTTRTV